MGWPRHNLALDCKPNQPQTLVKWHNAIVMPVAYLEFLDMSDLVVVFGSVGVGDVVDWVPTSTLIMTVLLGIGLFFFLRASGKDRIETRRYTSEVTLDELGRQVRHHLMERAYQLESVDEQGIATFVGQAQPSLFLTLFLTGLAFVGLMCLIGVLNTLYPGPHPWFWVLTLLAPAAGGYYRSANTREESLRVLVKQSSETDLSQLAISGHRDELDTLETTLGLAWSDDE